MVIFYAGLGGLLKINYKERKLMYKILKDRYELKKGYKVIGIQ